MADEVVLVAADERVAERFGIGLHAHAEDLRGVAGAIAEIGFGDALDLEHFQGNDGQKHIDVDVRDHGVGRHGGMSREVL